MKAAFGTVYWQELVGDVTASVEAHGFVVCLFPAAAGTEHHTAALDVAEVVRNRSLALSHAGSDSDILPGSHPDTVVNAEPCLASYPAHNHRIDRTVDRSRYPTLAGRNHCTAVEPASDIHFA